MRFVLRTLGVIALLLGFLVLFGAVHSSNAAAEAGTREPITGFVLLFLVFEGIGAFILYRANTGRPRKRVGERDKKEGAGGAKTAKKSSKGFLRETVDSLRIYFGLSALYAGGMGWMLIQNDTTGLGIMYGGFMIGVGVVFLVCALYLRYIIRWHSPLLINFVTGMLWVSLAGAISNYLTSESDGSHVTSAIGLAISYYILVNVKRLVKEDQAPVAPPEPDQRPETESKSPPLE